MILLGHRRPAAHPVPGDEVDTPAEYRAWDRDMARAEAEAQDRLPDLSDL